MDGWNKNLGFLIWITGLAGSGKTTIAHEFISIAKTHGQHFIHLDGDCLRDALGNHEYDLEQRLKLGLIYSRLCKILVYQGFNVICSTMSLFDQVHNENRQSFSRYLEVFLYCSQIELEKRDQKGLYSAYKNGTGTEVMGRDQRVECPNYYDLLIDTSAECSAFINASKVYDHFLLKEIK